MSREITAQADIAGYHIEGGYKTEFESPIMIKPCDGRIILVKEKGMIRKEKWYMQVHLDADGNTKMVSICLDQKGLKK